MGHLTSDVPSPIPRPLSLTVDVVAR